MLNACEKQYCMGIIDTPLPTRKIGSDVSAERGALVNMDMLRVSLKLRLL